MRYTDGSHRQSTLVGLVDPEQVWTAADDRRPDLLQGGAFLASALTYAPRLTLEQISLAPSSEPSPAAEVAVTDEFVHPGAIALAMGGFGLFIVASWAGWSFGYTALLLAVVTGLAAV